jgi:ribosomal protein RSM22 (predicted rRNA methylase)
MELPSALREAVNRALEGVPASDLARASAALSQRYRAETRDKRWHVSDDLSARAYLAARLPATYAAVRAAMEFTAVMRPEFSPSTLLDVGAGPGTALWAAADCWPDVANATMVEGSAAMRNWGETLARAAHVPQVAWHGGDAVTELSKLQPHDLVTLAYVLSELAPDAQDKLVEKLWALTGDTLLVVEPGTPAGWSRILRARDALIHAGASIVAPCPHAKACPLQAPDWCHFARRVSRSRIHRLAKEAEVPWEDEKDIYLAVSRHAATVPQARVIAPPQHSSGKIALKLCEGEGTCTERLVTRREGEDYKIARRLEWGDALP